MSGGQGVRSIGVCELHSRPFWVSDLATKRPFGSLSMGMMGGRRFVATPLSPRGGERWKRAKAPQKTRKSSFILRPTPSLIVIAPGKSYTLWSKRKTIGTFEETSRLKKGQCTVHNSTPFNKVHSYSFELSCQSLSIICT